MSASIFGFGLPRAGEQVVCGRMVFEWDVVEEIDAMHERWGWVPFCPVVDAAKLCNAKFLPVVASLPQFPY